MIYYDILRSSITTLDQLEQISFEIDALLDSLYKTWKGSFEKSLDSISPETSQAIKATIKENKISLDNIGQLKELLTGLKEQIHKLKPIEITLAFSPPEAIIKNIFDWVIKNLGFGLILDIKIDKTILGGAIINFNGKYKDYSLKKRMDEIFAAKREEIRGIVSL